MISMKKVNDSQTLEVAEKLLPYIYCHKFVNIESKFGMTMDEMNALLNSMGSKGFTPNISYIDFKEILFNFNNSKYSLYLLYDDDVVNGYAVEERINGEVFFSSDVDHRFSIEEWEVFVSLMIEK